MFKSWKKDYPINQVDHDIFKKELHKKCQECNGTHFLMGVKSYKSNKNYCLCYLCYLNLYVQDNLDILGYITNECDAEHIQSLSHIKYFSGSLYSYQRDIVDKMNSMDKCLLSLDMGLGKTIISLYITQYVKKTCIIVPANIIMQWKNECNKFLPNRTV